MELSNERKKLVVAGAGTGKTRMLRDIAIKHYSTCKVLYLTYTNVNAHEFESTICERLKFIPSNITVMTWFSFLLAHGVRPFPAQGFTHRIDKMLFNDKDPTQRKGIKRGNVEYYCPSPDVVYRTRLADLTVLCNEQWNGEVVKRICSIYDVILIDEAQDYAGYDYNIMLALMDQSNEMTIVGDPRQQTYRTGNRAKNVNFPDVFEYFRKKAQYRIDTTSLINTYRCSEKIMELANKLYPDLPQLGVSSERASNPFGAIHIIKEAHFKEWVQLRERPVTALTWNARTKVPDCCNVMNMGDSKGLTLGDVAIFPTIEMKKWLNDDKSTVLKPATKAKLYVAITRASGDLVIVI